MDSRGLSERLGELRESYSIIYEWHAHRGASEFRSRCPRAVQMEETYAIDYLTLVKTLPPPETADARLIGNVAREVLMGLLEWSYMETHAGVAMHEAASRIMSIIEDQEVNQGADEQYASLRKLRNTSRDGVLVPDLVEVPIPGSGHLPREEYQHLAEFAYSDVPCGQGCIGGATTLTDSNLEVWRSLHSEDSRIRGLQFRNAAALHFREVAEQDSLVSQAQAGRLTVESVTIGGTHELDRRRHDSER